MTTPLHAVRPLAAPVRAAAQAGRAVFLSVLPDGGQLGSRRNAWSAMSVNAGRARARHEAAAALDAAAAPAQRRYGLP